MKEEQSHIAAELGVDPHFEASAEIARRTQFLVEYARAAAAGSLVLGISGGVDSSVAGRLCQLAAEQLRSSGMQLRFIAMRLPYGVQADQADAQRAISFIDPDETLYVDIKPAADAMLAQLQASGLRFNDHWQEDFVLGNIKARQRMIAQYAVAGATGGLVVGTDHAAEAVMGFFTKFGDGGFDLSPLGGLTKRRVRALAVALGGDEQLANKVPTADLESMRPLRPDEAAMGVSYDAIDDFLEGKEVDLASAEVVVQIFRRTAHKRALPAVPVPKRGA
ncbi:NAD(+) synthase [Cupriavidus sp. USMAA2-4]|jgi:NAD+ synthase|uniref:ammonia-dependent NAD(+) synthetase n=1 Tax=Cupriavidus TaxID=106589 RepID=UPI0008A6C075|nr:MULTISPECIES: ammonia-dependent NAD(+) synthetase [Cupriavidus]AOY93097.1 NAD(+) synthase [Cupriavidus sp. USMAA2-4]MBY4948974.1 ammonia-dependent NAD(+) synthetase [Cupriavidus respiraculi]